MGLGKIIRSSWWGAGCTVVLSCAMVQVLPAKAVRQRHVELTLWEQAERGREALEAMPAGTRTRADYARAMDGFRAVYHEAPGDMHAPDSVTAVAELLAEQGRGLHDAKSLKAAVGQYEFLRTQYPGSSLRVGALLAEGQIYENDLQEAAAARERYSLLVKEYPRSEMAEEARAGLASLDQSGHKDQGATEAVTAAPVGSSVPSVAAPVAKESGAGGMPAVAGAKVSSGSSAVAERQGVAAPVDEAGGTASNLASGSDAGAPGVAPMHVAKAVRHGHMAQVTGIRHWSTPNYTRVAIDLGDDVTYEAARVPNPDRIYFDLHGTRLAQELVGKSFAVTDDGFLKKIRAAQFSNDMTRVVLDVNDVTEYSAFLLPNPYRLIIDIHGGSKSEPGAALVSVPMQRAAAPAPSVPNTTAVKSASSFDVAAVSAQPGRVEATTQPTSQPISAVVSDRTQVGKTQSENSAGQDSGFRVEGSGG